MRRGKEVSKLERHHHLYRKADHQINPNLWYDEHKNPRYIIDLLKSIVNLSLDTMKIIKSLPKLGL